MQIDIEKYSQVLLSDVGKIYSPIGFLREQREKGDLNAIRTFLFCPDTYIPGQMEVSLVEANGIMKGYAVIPNSSLNIVYLASILNTAVSWAVMTDGKLEKRTSITMKRLGNVLVRILPPREQQAVAYLHYLFIDIGKQKKEGNKDPYLNYWASVYEQLRDAIALELVLPKVFQEYEIKMLESWCSLIGQCLIKYPEFEWIRWQDYLGKELLAPQNIVTGNMNKLRVVMNNVVEQVKEKL